MTRILFLIAVLQLFVAFASCTTWLNADCDALLHNTPDDSIEATLSCSHLGQDDRTFADVVGNWTIKGPGLGSDEPDGMLVRNLTMLDFLKKVLHIELYGLYHKISLGENALVPFPNLESIRIWRTLTPDDRNLEVTIPVDAFRQTPRLKKVVMGNLALPESTIQALASLKNQLEEIHANHLKPEERMLTEIANFTKLRTLIVHGMCTGRTFPTAIFEKSAPTLEVIKIQQCPLDKITKNLFSSMPNLKELRWDDSEITEIEPDAFDGNPKLQTLYMRNNKIRDVPDGLFSKLMKLEVVDFGGNELRGLSRSNFTHVEKYNTSFIFNDRRENTTVLRKNWIA